MSRSNGRHIAHIPLSNEFIFASISMLMMVSGMLSEIFNIFGSSYPTGIVFACVYALSLLAWMKSLVHRPLLTISVAACLVFLVLLAQMISPGVLKYIFNAESASLYSLAKTEFVFILFLCLPPFLLSFGRIDKRRLFRYLNAYSRITTSLFVVLMLSTIFVGTETFNYMSIAYNALPGISLLFLDWKLNHRKISGILWVAGACGLFIGGCRGALITFMVLYFVWWLHTLHHITATRFLFISFVCILGVIVVTNLPYFVNALQNFLQSLGYSSRILTQILTSVEGESFFEYDTRGVILDIIIKNFNLFGHGIYSDRILLEGVYPHNILFELWYQFGLIFGSLIVLIGVLVLGIVHRIAVYRKDKYLLAAWTMLFSIVCIKLMVSSTYLSDFSFWFTLGFVIVCLRNPSKRRIITNEEDS